MAQEPIKEEKPNLEMQRPKAPELKDEKPDKDLTPSKLGLKNRIYCTVWDISDTDEIEGKTKKSKPGKDSIKIDGAEYNIILSHRQWRKAGLGNKKLVLNYKRGEPNPISYRLPTVYADAILAQEIHRRKAYRSLLNKLETIVLVMVIASMLAAAAGIALYIYGQVTNRQEINKITAEKNAIIQDNNLLKIRIAELEGRQ